MLTDAFASQADPTIGVYPSMPIRKATPYRTIVRKLLDSKKLTKAEHAAFLKMADESSKGQELTSAQCLWITRLNTKYLVS